MIITRIDAPLNFHFTFGYNLSQQQPKWRNRQTRTTQNRVPSGMWVRFPPSAHLPDTGVEILPFPISSYSQHNNFCHSISGSITKSFLPINLYSSSNVKYRQPKRRNLQMKSLINVSVVDWAEQCSKSTYLDLTQEQRDEIIRALMT
jgi:hypothetical protein